MLEDVGREAPPFVGVKTGVIADEDLFFLRTNGFGLEKLLGSASLTPSSGMGEAGTEI